MREPAWSRRFWWLGRSRSKASCSPLHPSTQLVGLKGPYLHTGCETGSANVVENSSGYREWHCRRPCQGCYCSDLGRC